MTKLRSCGAFKTPGRKIAVGLRHWVAGRSMKGTKQLFFRASRYSVHQFLQSFTALLTLFLLIPKALHKTVKGVKHGLSSLKSGEDGEPGRGVVVGALVAAKDAVLSIPSLIRSGFAAIQVQLYGFTHSFYHLLESIKHFFVGITGSFTSLQLSISHALEAIKSCIVGSLSSVNLFLAHVLEYLAGLWQSFKTGTSHTVDRLKLREKTWTAKVFAYFDDGKDYVSRVLTKVADAVKDFCHRLTSMFDRTPAISEAATPVMRGKELVGDGENHLVVKIKNTAITIQAKAADLVHGIQVGTVHMVHHVRDGIPRAKESVALFFKANLEKTKKAVIHGELFVKRKVHATRVATSMGLSAVGRSTMKFCKALASPFVYFIELPMKFMMSIYTAPLWTYMYVFGVCGGLSYLGFLSKTRYANETYSRKLKPSKKVSVFNGE